MSAPRVAVVTGGNRGIGLEICRQLAGLGLHVVLTARDEAQAKEAAGQLVAEVGGFVVGARLDVRNEESVRTTFADIARSHGSVDVLVNNAGVAMDGSGHRPSAPDFARVEKTLDTNLYGAWRCATAAVPFMLARGYGRIVNLSTTNAASPGYTKTDMSPNATRPVADGADTPVWLATLPDDGPSGGFFYERAPLAW
jgi:NAD(P)-dependent dehydrogenase (short-subunit alcohol dehydrogenase family)